MKPAFALSLSFDGIALLHRAADGWRLVGDVSLESDDLAADLADLRMDGARLSEDVARVKLVIPNDQIRFLTIDTEGVSEDALESVIHAELDGATPYAVSELAFDARRVGPTTRIAAVARETLGEAEGFARDNGFQPLCFVATPDPADFPGEAFFGAIGNARIDRDMDAIRVVGDVIFPEPEDTPEPEVEDEEPPAPMPVFSARPRTPLPDRIAAPAPDPAPDSGNGAAAPRITLSDEAAPPAAPVARRDVPAPAASAPWVDADGSISGPPPSALASLQGATRTPDPDPVSLSASAPVTPSPAPAPPETEQGTATRPKRGLLRRTRAAASTSADADVDPESPTEESLDESQRLTIFGAREPQQVGGKPRYLGLALTAALLIFLAGMAAWAAIFVDEDSSWLFGPRSTPEVETALSDLPDPIPDPDLLTAAANDPDLTLSDTDAAVLDALRDPLPDPVDTPTTDLAPAQTPDEGAAPPDPALAEALYAATGIWPFAPEPPGSAGMSGFDEFYLTSIDPVVVGTDAVALPSARSLVTDLAPGRMANPTAPGTVFDLDARGLVIATPDGALNPDGVMVYLGQPPLIPPPIPAALRPATAQPDPAALAAIRPRARPTNLVELTERAQLGGRTRAELAAIRPKTRPDLPEALVPTDDAPTAQAVAASIAPRLRPADLDTTPAPAPAPTAVAARPASLGSTADLDRIAAVAPRAVSPDIPSSASVARQATVQNAINLRRVNLIGVYGTAASRRALVRMPNGRYRKVEVGDRMDGGRVSAIGESELRYQKNGRDLVLKMPSG